RPVRHRQPTQLTIPQPSSPNNIRSGTTQILTICNAAPANIQKLSKLAEDSNCGPTHKQLRCYSFFSEMSSAIVVVIRPNSSRLWVNFHLLGRLVWRVTLAGSMFTTGVLPSGTFTVEAGILISGGCT